MKLKERKLKECTQEMKEWNQKMKDWKMNSYLLREKYIDYLVLPTSTTTIGWSNQRTMCWNNLEVVSHALHDVSKSYINVVNDITTFVEPTPPTNIITNYTLLTPYIIKQRLKVFGLKCEAAVQK